jgi:LPS export ABC transporter protein LptC
MKKLKTIQFMAAAMLLAVGLSGCAKKKEQPPKSEETVFVPYQEFSKSTMNFYRGKYIQSTLKTDYMRKTLSDTAHTLVVPVSLETYDTTGKLVSHILADSGLIAPNNMYFHGWGNVYVKRSDNLTIKSQSLWWDRRTKKVGSEEFVEICTPGGDVLRGKGLDATESFSNWKLRQEVSGKFPNFKKRVDSNEF